MNENLNLEKILKYCPKGTKLYSTVFGEVTLEEVKENSKYPIMVKTKIECFESFTSSGRWMKNYDGECLLFPSKEQRDWSKFKPKKDKFDPKTLQPFDKVIVRDRDVEHWICSLFSHIVNDEYLCIGSCYKHCIPYNEETKHLVGTAEEAPEFYKYWETD